MRFLFTYLTFVSLVFGPILVIAQQDTLILKFDKDNYESGDTLSFAAFYTNKGVPVDKGTLFLKLVDQTGRSMDMRWPILGGLSQGNLVIPDSFPPSKLKFFFGASRQFFVVYGFIKQPVHVKTLNISLVTQANQLLVEDLPVSENGFFEYKDRVFENEATIFFSTTKGNTNDLDIEIASLVDSIVPILAHVERELNIGSFQEIDTLLAKLTYKNIDSFLNARAKLLAPVIVSARKLTMAEKFDNKYTTGFFRGKSPLTRIFDLLEQRSGVESGNLIDYLNQVVFRNYLGLSASIQYYLDEMRVEREMLQYIPVSEFAFVKTFPSPFFSNPTGTGGAIAVYTKRGEFYMSPIKHTFRVKGYTPQLASLKLGF